MVPSDFVAKRLPTLIFHSNFVRVANISARNSCSHDHSVGPRQALISAMYWIIEHHDEKKINAFIDFHTKITPSFLLQKLILIHANSLNVPL